MTAHAGVPPAEADLIAALDDAAAAHRRLPADMQRAVDAGIAGGGLSPRLYGAALRYGFMLGDPLKVDPTQMKQWLLGVDALLEDGHLDAAAQAVPLLARAYPESPWLQTWELVFRRLPPPDPAREPFHDDPTKAIQLAPRPGAATVIVAFRDVAHRIGTPVTVMHRWLGKLDAHILYLRDTSRMGFAGGIASIAEGAEAAAAHIRALVQETGARRIVTFGNSLGGYAALRYAPLLGADRALAFIPATGGFDHVPEDRREEMVRAGWVDTVPLYARPGAPHARILFGAQNGQDRAAALRLSGLPNVALEALPNWKTHDVAGALLRAGRMDAVFGWLTAPGYELDSGALLAADADLSEPRPPSAMIRAFGRLRRMLATRG